MSDAPAEEIEAGRYCYCLVRLPESDGDGEEGDGEAHDRTFEATGVEGNTAYLVTEADAGVGAIVHDCEAPYDSADPAEVRRWILAHQGVIDEAGDAFGTPLPCRFDTIFEGGDEAVREWLRERGSTLRDHLDDLAGHWEYRIEVTWTDDGSFEATARAEDDRLAELHAARADADEGRRFLLEKQYEQRLAELRRRRRAGRADDLRERLDGIAREVERLDDRHAAAFLDEQDGGTDEDDAADEDAAGEGPSGDTVRFSVLVAADREDALGEMLEEVAAGVGVEVAFTGPWPPYTFAPGVDEA